MDKIYKKIAHRQHGNCEAVESARGLFETILSQLPVKSILISKSVSKHWCSVISAAHFMRLQLGCSKSNLKYIIFPHPEDYGVGIVKELCLMEGDGMISQRYIIPGLEQVCTVRMICTFNGLVCLANELNTSSLFDVDIRICNPATREVLLLPKGSSSVEDPLIGVLFSTGDYEYKVFKFFSEKSESKDGRDLCEVYSSQTRTWKGIGRVESCPMANLYCPLVPHHVCANGKLYWFICSEEDDDTPGSILSIDMDEKFGTIDLPDEVTPWSFLIEFDGELCLVSVDEVNCILDVWTYSDNGGSWSLRGSAEFDVGANLVRFDTVAARGDEILFIVTDTFDWRHSIIYNVGRGMWRDFHMSDAFEEEMPVVFPFSESLLPCRG